MGAVRPSPERDRDRDLVEATRGELAAIEPARVCCRVAERAGLGAAATGRARSAAIARLAVRLEEAQEPAEPFSWDSAADHCRFAYLRGRFLAVGSLSLAAGRPHLEFVLAPGEAEELSARLRAVGLPAAVRVRRGRGVVTWKSTEAILAFLRRAGASASALEVEARLVNRSLRGHLNRVINAESANLQRSVATASRQLRAIEALEATGALARVRPSTRAVARLRREAPEASFSELAQRLGISRSLVQRAFAELEALSLGAEEAAVRG